MKEKIDEIHFETLQRILQIKVMLKCLEISCYYSDDLTTKEIMLFTEVLSQKANEADTYIDKLSII